MQAFLGKINFVRRFVPIFSETVRPLQQMIKKNVEFKWGDLKKQSFCRIKESIVEAPSLAMPDFSTRKRVQAFPIDITLCIDPGVGRMEPHMLGPLMPPLTPQIFIAGG